MARRTRGRPPHPDVLTPTEWSVLNMWRHGMTMAAIAERREISRYAVRYHLRNATEKLGIDSTDQLRHFPGFPLTSARTASHQKGSAVTAPQSNDVKLGPLGQVSMLTRSATKAEAWYRDTLGLAHIFTFGDLAFFDCGGTRLYLREVPDEEWRASSILYFLVPDIAHAHAQLSERGINFNGAPHMIFRDDSTGIEEWMAFFDDPDGNTLAIMARVSAAQGGENETAA
jgi:DNA-binding CsgD family transcriptional regulator/catechol 2,3-dioxygenase-like lactoylglutathione lyase family enzyme